MSRSDNQNNWPHHIAQQKRSGLSVKEYCKQNDLKCWAFYYNVKKASNRLPIRRKKAKLIKDASFVNLGLLLPQKGVSIIFQDGTRIELHDQQSPEQLVYIVNALRSKGTISC
jgi:hypothetical protein